MRKEQKAKCVKCGEIIRLREIITDVLSTGYIYGRRCPGCDERMAEIIQPKAKLSGRGEVHHV